MRGSWAQALLAVLLGVAAEAALSWLLQRRRERSVVHEALFFPSPVTCVEALLAKEGSPTLGACACQLPHQESSLSRLLSCLLAAHHSLDLCIFAFSSPQLCRAILLLHRHRVRVRVVTDADYMALKGSQIGILRKAGIQVRHDQETGYMHNKFVIIDKKVLITGSLNWTTQAIQNNRENALITDDKEFVNIFLAEFEKLWEDYNPTNYTFFTN